MHVHCVPGSLFATSATHSESLGVRLGSTRLDSCSRAAIAMAHYACSVSLWFTELLLCSSVIFVRKLWP